MSAIVHSVREIHFCCRQRWHDGVDIFPVGRLRQVVNIPHIVLIAQIEHLDIVRAKINQHNTIGRIVPHRDVFALARIGVIAHHFLRMKPRNVLCQGFCIHIVNLAFVSTADHRHMIYRELRQIVIAENRRCTCLFSVSHCHIAAGHTENKECQTDNQRTCAALRGLHNGLEPVTHRRSRCRKAGGKAPVISGSTEDQICILCSFGFIRLEEHRFVTAQFQVFGTLFHGDPHQRIEPAHGSTKHQKEFRPAVLTADVDQFMPKDQAKFLR